MAETELLTPLAEIAGVFVGFGALIAVRSGGPTEPLEVAPVIILLGVVPELEAALYYALVVLILLGAGWALLMLVFAQRRPASA